MRNIAALLALVFTLGALGQSKPVSVKGQLDAAYQLPKQEIQVPNRQYTNLGGLGGLIETGNKNLLANPSFEHSTVSSSWTVVTGTTAAETTIIQDGLRSISLTRPTSGPTALSQSVNTSFISGQQGFMSCRVRTNQPSMRICPVVDGVTQTSICSTIAPSSSYFNYRTAFLFGASTSGLIVESTANGTGITYVDDCTLQLAQPSDFIDVAQIGPWISWTPTGSWVSNTTYIGRYRIVGNNVEFAVELNLVGAPTSAALTINLPSGFAINTSQLTSAGLEQNLGDGTALDAGINGYSLAVKYSSTTAVRVLYLDDAAAAVSNVPSVTQAAPFAFGNTDALYLRFTTPIQGLSNKVSTYSQACTTDVQCENRFNVRLVGSTCAVVAGSDSPSGWVASTSKIGSGQCRITYSGLGLTQTPVVNNSVVFTGGYDVGSLLNPSTTSVDVVSADGGVLADPSEYHVTLTKTGADFRARNIITGTFQDVVVAPNTGSLKTCLYSFGGASSTLTSPTECTSGACVEIYDSCNAATPPTRSGSAGVYNDLTFAAGTWRASSFVDCKCVAYDTTSTDIRQCTPYFVTGDQTIASNPSGGYVGNFYIDNTLGTNIDGYMSVECKGLAP